MVLAVTDNKQRTVAEVKNIFDKSGGVLGAQGSVSYLFEKKGQIVAKKGGYDSDTLLSKGIDAGVQDMIEEGDVVSYFLDVQDLQKAKKSLEESDVEVESAEISYVPTTPVDVQAEVGDKILNLIGKLEESDDVQQVYTNLA
jgi:YebC/PmpR family DNA-binding regulatory protein